MIDKFDMYIMAVASGICVFVSPYTGKFGAFAIGVVLAALAVYLRIAQRLRKLCGRREPPEVKGDR